MFFLHDANVFSVDLLHLFTLLGVSVISLVKFVAEFFLKLLDFFLMSLSFLLKLLLRFLNRLDITGTLGAELLDLQGKLVDDAPCNQMLAGQPRLSLCVSGFAEEDCKMKQISELICLIYAHVDARLLLRPALLVHFQVGV